MPLTKNNKLQLAKFWQAEIDLANRENEKWIEKGERVIKRYKDERDRLTKSRSRFNILWSNVRTLMPATYAKKPKPLASRRFKDADPKARAAATMLERCLEFEVEQYPDFDSGLRNAVFDRLLPGRGVVWVRYEAKDQAGAEIMGESAAPDQADAAPGVEDAADVAPGSDALLTDDVAQQVDYECAAVDYVYWKDFLHSPARTWEEVRWVARKTYLTRKQLVKRFGKAGKDVPLENKPPGVDANAKDVPEEHLKGEVYEIWDKEDRSVCWWAKGVPGVLDVRDDPLGLEMFFPCPKPLFASISTDSLEPMPDYAQYQDLADEVDMLTGRIGSLTKALKMTGVYDSSAKGLQRLLEEGNDGKMIPVESWAMFAEKGGVKGAVDFLPIDQIIKVVQGLYVARDQAKQAIYEITGMSDIIRGASDAGETATAQNIKSKFASLRLQETQNDVARFATDVLRMKAEIICKHFQPQTILQMSGIEHTQDAPLAMQAVQLLQQDPMRNFRIEVEADSMIELDERQEKEARVEFLTSVGGFMQSVLPVVQASPALGPLVGEMLMFGVRGFRTGRPIEASFEQAMAALQEGQGQPSPEEMQAQQAEQEQMQAAQQEVQQQAEANKTTQDAIVKAKHATEMQMKDLAHAKEMYALQQQLDAFMKQQSAQVDERAGEISQEATGAKEEADARVIQLAQTLEQAAAMQAQNGAEQAAMLQAIAEKLSQTAEAMAQASMRATADKVLVRDKQGRAIGVKTVEPIRETLQ
jgi:hypothetical protein